MSRVISKQPITMEDLAAGYGYVSQERDNKDVVLGRVDIPYSLDSVTELKQVDTAKFKRARVYDTPLTYVDYAFIEADYSGISSLVGDGSWLIITSNADSESWTYTISSESAIAVTTDTNRQYIRVQSLADTTVTLEQSTIGTIVAIRQETVYQITLAAGTGQEIIDPIGLSPYARGSVVIAECIGENIWSVTGDVG